MKNIIRKIKRNSSKKNTRADYIQVSYFNFSEGALPGWAPRKYRESTPKQKRLNAKKAKRYFEALVEANFKGNRDLVVHPTFSEDNYPESEEQAHKLVKNWIARLNYRRKKLGLPNCKYIIVFEKSPRGRMHFHVLMDGQLSREEVENKWQLGYCNADRLRSDPKIGLQKIISYLSKGGETDEKNSKRWISSKGLIKPWVSCSKNTKISRKRFEILKSIPEDSELLRVTIERDNPGYELQDVERSVSEETGQMYLFCRMRLNKGGEKERAKGWER